MSKVFKGEGGIIEQIVTKDDKKFEIINYYDKNDYIKYDNSYVSFTRIDYGSSTVENLPNSRPGQIIAGFINNFVTQITGITIYENIVYQNDCITKGRAINNFNCRSDYYIFNIPSFVVSGATKIMTGTTTASTGVYIVDTLSSLTFTAIFDDTSGYTESFFVGNNGITFDLYQRIDNSKLITNNINDIVVSSTNQIFGPNRTSSTGFFNKLNFSSYTTNYSALTFTYSLESFEGEFVIKGLYKWTNFTYFGNLMNLEHYEPVGIGSYPYSLYDSNKDYYFIYLKRAGKPTIFSNVLFTDRLPLNVQTIIPSFNGQVNFPLGIDLLGPTTGLLVSVNGLLLSTSEYIYSSSTLSINSGTILTSDIINVVYSNSVNTPPIQTESNQITSIPNTTYPSTGQKVIFNTTTNKYEYWLDYQTQNQPILSVNGQILSNDIDFYVSSSDKRRIIFESTLSVGDIITVFYNSIMNNGNNINSNIFTLSWSITDLPKNNLGYFITEITNYSDTSFSSPIYSAATFYVKNQFSYTINIPFSGNYGDKFLARVTNHKLYYTVLGELIETVNYSDTIPLTITTNALNNY